MKKLGLGVLLTLAAILAAAQTPAPAAGPNRQYVIAVCIDSSDLRLEQSEAALDKQAINAVERSADNVRAVAIPHNRQQRQNIEQARKDNADYLMTIRVSSQSPSQPAADLGGNARRNPEAFESIRDSQASTRIVTTVEPLNGSKVRLFDTRGVNGSNFASAAGAVTSTGTGTADHVPSSVVLDAASWAMTQLKQRGGLSQ